MEAKVKLKIQCPDCLTIQDVELPYDYLSYKMRYDKWKKGMLIQNAFPELTNSQREALITGICDICWDKMSEDIEIEAPF